MDEEICVEREPAAPGLRPGARGEAARLLDRGLPGGASAAHVAAFETLRGYGHPAAHNLSAGAVRGGPQAGGGACVRAAARRRGEALVPAGTPVGAVRVSAAGWEGWVLAGLAGLVARAPPPVRSPAASAKRAPCRPCPGPTLAHSRDRSFQQGLASSCRPGLRTAQSPAQRARCGPPHARRRARAGAEGGGGAAQGLAAGAAGAAGGGAGVAQGVALGARRCCCWSCTRQAWRRAGSRAARSRCSAACTPGATPTCRTRGAAPPAPSGRPSELRVVVALGALGRASCVCPVAVSISQGACLCPCQDACMHACGNERALSWCLAAASLSGARGSRVRGWAAQQGQGRVRPAAACATA
jgi:hypothetical protein